MKRTLKLSEEQRAQAIRNLQNGFAFTEDVLEDLTLLEGIPDGAEVRAIPKSEREPGQQYDVESRRMVATVILPVPERSPVD